MSVKSSSATGPGQQQSPESRLVDATTPQGRTKTHPALAPGNGSNSLTDVQVRDLAIQALAHSFAEVPDDWVEDRAYALEALLPTLIPALERLLHRVATAGGGERLVVGAPKTSSLMHCPDLPKDQAVHPVNFLAQSLFRVKGRTLGTEQDAVYQAELQGVVAELRVRFQRIEAERKEAAARALERAQQERLLKSMKRRDLFNQLLRNVFDKWTASLWRTQPAYLYHKEWLVFLETGIQGEGVSAAKVKSFNSSIRKLDGSVQSEGSPTSAQAISPGGLVDGQRRVYKEQFLQVTYRCMGTWSEAELKVYVDALDAYAMGVRGDMVARFGARYFVPKFHDLPAGSTEWLKEVGRFFASYHHGGEHQEELEQEFLRFVRSEHTGPMEDAYESLMRDVAGKYGIATYERVLEELARFEREVRAAQAKQASAAKEGNGGGGKGAATSLPPGKNGPSVRNGRLVDMYEGLKAQGTISIKRANQYIAQVLQTDVNLAIKSALTNMRFPEDGVEEDVPLEVLVAFQEKALKATSNDDFTTLVSSLKQLIKMDAQKREETERVHKRATALASVARAAETLDLNVQHVCATFATLVASSISNIYKVPNVSARIILLEQAVTRLRPVDGEMPSLAEATASTSERSVLRCAAVAGSTLPQGLVGQVLAEEQAPADVAALSAAPGVLAIQHLATAHPTDLLLQPALAVTDESGIVLAAAAPAAVAGAPTTDTVDVLYFGVPLASKTGDTAQGTKPTGILSLALEGAGTDVLSDSSANFLTSVAEIMADALGSLKRRIQVAELTRAIQTYIAHQAEDLDVDVFVRDEEGSFLYHFIPRHQQQQPLQQPAEGLPQDGLVSEPCDPALDMELVSEMPEEVMELVTQGFEEGKTLEIQANGLRTGAYVPVQDEAVPGKAGVLALVKMQAKGGKELTSSRLGLVKRLLPAMASSIRKAARKAAAWRPADKSASLLDIEFLDDKTREQLLFPRTLFQGARQNLLKIDNTLFSELRSYRDPPKLICLVLKGVLYLFGARPRELREWRDMSKMINKELLQKMTKYDPTTVQKKLRFKRLRRILGVLERQEISKRGSQPAQVIHEWLVVAYELRQKAVEARARRADIFSRSDILALESPSPAEAEEVDAEAEAEEGEVASRAVPS